MFIMEDNEVKKTEHQISVAQKLQTAFGASAVNSVSVEMQLAESVSDFLRAMDVGKERVSKCKIAFGD